MYDVPTHLHRSLKKEFCSLPKLYFMAQSAHLQKIKNEKKNKKLCIQPVIHSKVSQTHQKLRFHQLIKYTHDRRKSFSNSLKSQLENKLVHKKYSLQHKNINNGNFPLRIDNISFCKRKISEYDQQLSIEKVKRKQSKKLTIRNDDQKYCNKLKQLNCLPLEHILSNRTIMTSQKHKKMQTQPSVIEHNRRKAVEKIARFFPLSLQMKECRKIKSELSPWEFEATQYNYNTQQV